MWDNLVDNFSTHANEIEEILSKAANGMKISNGHGYACGSA
jgi:homogentisate 1,2-dioxygenase